MTKINHIDDWVEISTDTVTYGVEVFFSDSEDSVVCIALSGKEVSDSGVLNSHRVTLFDDLTQALITGNVKRENYEFEVIYE